MLGEQEERTCDNCTGTQTTPGVGLTPLIQEEYDAKLKALQDLISGAKTTTPDNLQAAGSDALPITRGVIEALRDEPDQSVLTQRLAWEAALSSVLEKPLLLHRTLLTGSKEPGLEYHSVIFVGLDDGAWWSFSNDQIEATAGFFVAFTRANNVSSSRTVRGVAPEQRLRLFISF